MNAFGGVKVDDLDAVFAEPVDAAVEIDGLADDYSGDAELADEAAAIPARRQRGDHNLVAIGALTAGTAEGVGFSVDGGIVLLDTAVVAPPSAGSLSVEKSPARRRSA